MALFKPAWQSKNPKKVLAFLEKKYHSNPAIASRTFARNVVADIISNLNDDDVCRVVFENIARWSHVLRSGPNYYSVDECILYAERCPAPYVQTAYASILLALCKKTSIEKEEEYLHYCNVLRVYEKVTEESVRVEARGSSIMQNPPDEEWYKSHVQQQKEMEEEKQRKLAEHYAELERKKKEKENWEQYHRDARYRAERESWESGGGGYIPKK